MAEYKMRYMIRIKVIISALVIATGFSVGCSKGSSSGGNGQVSQPPVNCEAIQATFSGNVAAIIQTQCAVAGCHAAGSINGPGPLTNFNQIKAASLQVKDAVVSRRMPAGGALSQAQINQIVCWVDSGAPAN